MKSLKVRRNKNPDTLKKTQIQFPVNPGKMLCNSTISMIVKILKNSTKFLSVLPQQTSSFPTTSQFKRCRILILLKTKQNNGNFLNQKALNRKI